MDMRIKEIVKKPRPEDVVFLLVSSQINDYENKALQNLQLSCVVY